MFRILMGRAVQRYSVDVSLKPDIVSFKTKPGIRLRNNGTFFFFLNETIEKTDGRKHVLPPGFICAQRT